MVRLASLIPREGQLDHRVCPHRTAKLPVGILVVLSNYIRISTLLPSGYIDCVGRSCLYELQTSVRTEAAYTDRANTDGREQCCARLPQR